MILDLGFKVLRPKKQEKSKKRIRLLTEYKLGIGQEINLTLYKNEKDYREGFLFCLNHKRSSRGRDIGLRLIREDPKTEQEFPPIALR